VKTRRCNRPASPWLVRAMEPVMTSLADRPPTAYPPSSYPGLPSGLQFWFRSANSIPGRIGRDRTWCAVDRATSCQTTIPGRWARVLAPLGPRDRLKVPRTRLVPIPRNRRWAWTAPWQWSATARPWRQVTVVSASLWPAWRRDNNMYYRNITIKSSTAAVGLWGWDSVKKLLKICRLQKNRAVKSRGSLWLGVAKRAPVNEDAIESKRKNTQTLMFYCSD